ncbi:MAG: Rrf2 family transcriptional regulator, partial [Clostridiales bacterium]|nr:Rrf2 family transcriptional regulator [Clostridiales bacterium]
LSVSIHILCLISRMGEEPLTSEYIASSINTNPVLVRRLMSRLKKANLIDARTKLGVTGLSKKAEEISLLDIFIAVEDNRDLFDIHSNTNHNCPVGARIEDTLKNIYVDIQATTEKKLSAITLADVTKELI